MSFWQVIQSHSAAILAGLVIVYGAVARALPAQSSDFKWGQFVIDFIKGIGQQLPSDAQKLTSGQKAMLLNAPAQEKKD